MLYTSEEKSAMWQISLGAEIEIHPCKVESIENGVEHMVQCQPNDVDLYCWSVYVKNDNLLDWVADLESEKVAREYASRLTQLAPDRG